MYTHKHPKPAFPCLHDPYIDTVDSTTTGFVWFISTGELHPLSVKNQQIFIQGRLPVETAIGVVAAVEANVPCG